MALLDVYFGLSGCSTTRSRTSGKPRSASHDETMRKQPPSGESRGRRGSWLTLLGF